jgi:hypothetical protein
MVRVNGAKEDGVKNSSSSSAFLQLPVHIENTMDFDTYRRFLAVPRMLDVQLKAPDASTEDVKAYPARLSKEGKFPSHHKTTRSEVGRCIADWCLPNKAEVLS